MLNRHERLAVIMESFGTLILILVSLIVSAQSIGQSPPRIVKQPPSDELLFQVAVQQNENDKPFIIECEAEGEPAPKYRWIKNGKNFNWQTYDERISQQPGRGTLVITSPRDEDIGQYQCFAENEWGIATSNSVFVRKAELNSFKEEQPITLTAEEGKPFKLTCNPPDGWPKPNVYWLIQNSDGGIKSINNSRMTLDPEGNLCFSNVTQADASDDFTYACSATSVFRNEYKLGNRVNLQVLSTGVSASQNRHQPVAQYLSRKNEIALRGKKVEIYCIYGGTPLPQIRWSKQGGALPPERTTQGNYGKTLIIKHVNFEDAGTYGCEASNGVGEAKSHAVSLTVLAAPYFTVVPQVALAAEEEEVTFRCEASGEPKPQISWIYNGKPIEQAPPNPRRKVTPNSITIERLEKKDTGNYGCNATNSLGYVYRDVYVNVQALPPEIIESPNDEATVDGKTIRLTCHVTGAPKPVVKWVKNDLELTGGRYEVMDDGDLEIRNVDFQDSGPYKCIATNKFGTAEASGTLAVKEHTQIVQGPEDYEVAAGTSATFRCNAVSDTSLKLTIEWLNNGQPLDFEEEPRFVRASDSSLTITKTSELDSGVYTCVAKTDLDEARALATLIVQDVPNPPSLKSVTCNRRDASVEWTPMGDNRAPILRYTIEYNTSFTPDTWEKAFDSVPATDMAYTVAMSPWANYTFRVIAWNKIGPSFPSMHSDVCTTQPDVPSKNPDHVEGMGTEPDNLVISWTPMPEIEHNAPNFMYRVYWKKDIPGEEWNSRDINKWENSSLLISNQPTYQRYRIKVVAINERGEANVSPKEAIGYSGEDVPTQAPKNFTLVQVTGATSGLLSWAAVSPESVRGNFKGYKIHTWTDREGESNPREIKIKGDSLRAVVNKFIPNTKNHARILVYNGRYNGPPSDMLSFDTPEGVPGTVQSFEAFHMGSSALYLVWKRPEQPNGHLTGYRIYYQVVKGTKVGPLMERKPHISDPKQTRAKLAGLETGAKYGIHIRATTRAGEGKEYFIEMRGSVASKPDPPKFKWHRLPSDNGLAAIKVVWLPNIEGKPGSHFYVRYRMKGEANFEKTNNEMAEDYIIVRGLRPGEVYEFLVVAVDGDYSSESEVEEVETYSIEHTQIVQGPEDYEVAAGTSATFRCNAVSDTSLKLTIEWLNNGQPLDFEEEPRFVRASDSSLTITKTSELDSGVYTCVAKTDLDEARALATLIVQDVPNPPSLKSVTCNRRDASVEWTPMGDNRAPILRYTIEYNTSFTPDTWEKAFDSVPATDMAYTVAMSPWANYTFRVIAWNKIGPSFPSMHSDVCTTQPDVPSKNPDHVEGMGTEPDNLVISWTPMPEIEHNAPNFMYRVYWKKDIPGEEWNSRDINKWENSSLLISNQPTYQRYRIKVVAINERGEANVSPKEAIGYSGEDVPTQAPKNFTLVQVTGATSGLLSWAAVSPESVRGNFKGYKIHTWTDREGESNPREIKIKGDSLRAVVNKFIPNTKNHARILVYNGRYNGPPSDMLSFDTPEGVPGTVQSFEAFHMGSSALYLVWKRPEQPNGHLTGYRIYYQVVKGTKVGPLMERKPHISDPKQTRAKLAGLETGAKYGIHIRATTRAGEGKEYFIEMRGSVASKPDPPKFKWHRLPSDNGLAAIKVVWLPNIEGKPGSHFYVRYRMKGEANFEKTNNEMAEDYIIVRGLRPGEVYEFLVVAVDGDYSSESEVEEVETYSIV
ncbi:neuroglian isoform X2 [Ischnura elegans]|uniref:neuroglian isoform X2 n=1 Tax=Ischnura elegans TaxID=197161 RepID=UPI001ED86977|nr:neuroglian isoform X2 [Ischnura elegans]